MRTDKSRDSGGVFRICFIRLSVPRSVFPPLLPPAEASLSPVAIVSARLAVLLLGYGDKTPARIAVRDMGAGSEEKVGGQISRNAEVFHNKTRTNPQSPMLMMRHCFGNSGAAGN
uniref:Uncharacterized protein n=1 Tax=Knipowitschia caucasica TaxID=637954 RepID=A0AAV2KM88_KNICA